jgi:hypothetical protein
VFDGKLLYSKIQKHNMELKYSLNEYKTYIFRAPQTYLCSVIGKEADEWNILLIYSQILSPAFYFSSLHRRWYIT